MNTDDVKRLAENPNFIPSIYTYCDRWCERCQFTSRCMNYAMGREMHGDDPELDMANEKFWEQMGEILALTMEMLAELAEEVGVNLDDWDEETYREEQAREDAFVRGHHLTEKAKRYVKLGRGWLESAGPDFLKKEDELNTFLRLNIPSADPEGQAARLTDAVEVIQWYLYFIQVKLMRALGGRSDDARFDDEGFPRDADGSAKIALIAMDRSLAAWGALLRAFPQRETETLEILAHLDRLRKAAEREFPHARAFVRPGFDE